MIRNLPFTVISGEDYLGPIYTVYAWLRKNQWLYVGQSETVFRRIYNHDILNTRESIRNTDKIVMWKCDSKLEMDVFERQLIQKHKPKYNIQFIKTNLEIEDKYLVEEYFFLNKILPASNATAKKHVRKKYEKTGAFAILKSKRLYKNEKYDSHAKISHKFITKLEMKDYIKKNLK